MKLDIIYIPGRILSRLLFHISTMFYHATLIWTTELVKKDEKTYIVLISITTRWTKALNIVNISRPVSIILKVQNSSSVKTRRGPTTPKLSLCLFALLLHVSLSLTLYKYDKVFWQVQGMSRSSTPNWVPLSKAPNQAKTPLSLHYTSSTSPLQRTTLPLYTRHFYLRTSYSPRTSVQFLQQNVYHSITQAVCNRYHSLNLYWYFETFLLLNSCSLCFLIQSLRAFLT